MVQNLPSISALYYTFCNKPTLLSLQKAVFKPGGHSTDLYEILVQRTKHKAPTTVKKTGNVHFSPVRLLLPLHWPRASLNAAKPGLAPSEPI